MFTQADKGILVRALMTRREEIRQSHRIACEVVQSLRHIGAEQDAISPHDRYIELYLQELADLADVLAKVGREL